MRRTSSRTFAASTLPFGNRSASDTINLVVTAPDGFYVSKITYTQRGIASLSRGAVQIASTQWVVDGFPSLLGLSANPNLTGTADLSKLQKQTIPLSITLSLFAAGPGYISVGSADVVVEVAPFEQPTDCSQEESCSVERSSDSSFSSR